MLVKPIQPLLENYILLIKGSFALFVRKILAMSTYLPSMPQSFYNVRVCPANTQCCSMNERAKFTETDESFQEQVGRLKHREKGFLSSKYRNTEKSNSIAILQEMQGLGGYVKQRMREAVSKIQIM